MTDIFTKKKRSEIMSKIGPRDSKPEIFVRELISSLGYKFTTYGKNLPGNPDIVFPRRKKVIFINGCFWHGHKGCKKANLPQTNRPFWKKKITGNIKKDKRDYRNLLKIGWKYLIIWQCGIKKIHIESLKMRILKFIKK